MRALPVLLAVAAFALAAYFTLHGSAPPSPEPSVLGSVRRPERSRPSAELTQPRADREEVPPAVETPRGLGPETRRVLREDLGVDDSDPEEPARVRLSGTLTIVDANGAEHTDVRASFGISTFPENWFRPLYPAGLVEVQVERGKWSCTVTENANVWIARLVDWLDRDEPCTLESPGPEPSSIPVRGDGDAVSGHVIGLPAERVLHLRARATPQGILRVVDAATGADLDRVSVLLPMTPHGGVPAAHPGLPKRGLWSATGQHAVLFEGAPSPLVLRAPRASALDEPITSTAQHRLELQLSKRGGVEFWVGSPGYAWRSASLRLGRSGPLRIGLSRGADLEVAFANAPEHGELFLRVRALQGGEPAELLAEVAADATPLLLRGLPAGLCSLAFELGERGTDAVRLGGTTAALLAGTVTRLQVRLDDLPEVSLEPLRGTLFVSEGWADLRPWLALRPLAGTSGASTALTPSLERTGPHTFSWSAGRVPRGRYAAGLPHFLARVVETGRENHLLYPEPALVDLTLVDSNGAAVTDVPSVHWHPGLPPGVRASGSAPVHLADGQGSFRAPAGEVTLQLDSMEWRLVEPSLTLAPGRHTLALPLERRTGVVVEVDSALMGWAHRKMLEGLEVRDGAGRPVRSETSTRNDARWVTLPGPGPFTVTLQAPDGFVAPAPIEFEAVGGQWVELSLALESVP